MRNRALAALLLAVVLILMLAPIALAQSPTPTVTPARQPGPLDTRALAETMGQTEFKIVLLVTIIFGALGGLVYELMVLQGSVETPHRIQAGGWMFDLGVWGRMLMGAMAAAAALYIAPPENAYKLVAVAVVAGVSASAIFKSLQSRVDALIAQQAASQAQDAVGLITEKAEQMAQALGVDDGSGSTRAIRAPGGPSLESERRAAQLLGEIRALGATVKRGAKPERRP